MTTVLPTQGVWGRYHRRLEHGDFSLEANTEAVPETGFFYLFRGDDVLLRCEDFPTAEAAYRNLCREHWEHHITSESPERRLASAWGLLGLEPGHPGALLVIERDGSSDDHARLIRVRNKQIHLARQARMRARGTAAKTPAAPAPAVPVPAVSVPAVSG